MERIINMILRRLLNKGINSGIRAANNRGNRNRDQSKTAILKVRANKHHVICSRITG
jgi:hypothetical protein